MSPATLTINNLPLEILTSIAALLPRSTFPALRLTSRALCHSASPLLYHTFALRYTFSSFQHLHNLATHPIYSTYIRALHFDLWETFQDCDTSSLEALPGLPNLKSVSFEFTFGGNPASGDEIRLVIELSEGVEEVRFCFGELDFKTFYNEHRLLDFGNYVPVRMGWLRRLELEAVVVGEGELRGFLGRHSKTLRELSLVGIIFLSGRGDGAGKEGQGDGKGGEEAPGSWLDMISWLHDSLSLTSMHFGGILSNNINEAWDASGTDKVWNVVDYSSRAANATLSSRGLKSQIERYICHLGEDPIVRLNRSQIEEEIERDDLKELLELRADIGEVVYVREDASWFCKERALYRLAEVLNEKWRYDVYDYDDIS